MRARWPLLFALVLVAGCTGQGSDGEGGGLTEAVSQLAGPSAEELARTPGSLRGIIHSSALDPIAGANVTEARLGIHATTDAAGFFLLPGLVSGEHLLTISAEGFATRSVSVNTQNGTTLEVNISLEPAPRAEPYVETRELAGFLACAALVQDARPDCASADPNHRDAFEFELANDGKNVVIELVWDAASTPAGSRMTLMAETVGYGAQDIELGNTTGSGYARVVVPQAVMEKYYPEGGLMRAIVTLAPGDAPIAVTAQARFTVYVSAFYHEAGPDAFSVLA